jgi:hypothetical protein
VREFSAVTRTPLSMFSPEGADQSAAGAENLSDGLVFKGEDRTARLTPPVARVFQLALAYAGEEDEGAWPSGGDVGAGAADDVDGAGAGGVGGEGVGRAVGVGDG